MLLVRINGILSALTHVDKSLCIDVVHVPRLLELFDIFPTLHFGAFIFLAQFAILLLSAIAHVSMNRSWSRLPLLSVVPFLFCFFVLLFLLFWFVADTSTNS